MTPPFPIVISPYDLDARGLVADVAFLLGAPTVTLLPAPFEGLDAASVNAIAASAPEFLRLINRWSWMQDLWRTGAIRPGFAGIQPIDLIQDTARELVTSHASSPLAAVLRPGVFDSTHTYLRALCRDLTVGGGQPSVSVPVTVGISRYAHALDAPLLQQQHARRTGSVVQKLESRATRTLASLALLIPRDIEPETTLALRDTLSGELTALRAILADPTTCAPEANLQAAESAFSEALLRAAGPHNLTDAPRRGRRLSSVLLSIATMPADTPLAAAMRASTLAAPRRSPQRSRADTAPAALAPRPLRILSVRELPWDHPASESRI